VITQRNDIPPIKKDEIRLEVTVYRNLFIGWRSLSFKMFGEGSVRGIRGNGSFGYMSGLGF
jgi:hypothetical protein